MAKYRRVFGKLRAPLLAIGLLAWGSLSTTQLAASEPSGASPTAAVAGATNDPIAHYRAYEAAIARGDILAASQSAVLAWQTGERVWNGKNANLPGLAFNAAWSLGLVNKISEAQAPARRAAALATQYPGTVDPKEAAFLLAYADMVAAPSKSRVETFNVAARALDGGGWGDWLLARAYVDGARIALEVALPRVSRQFVDRGLTEANRVMPENIVLRTNLLVLRTQSSLHLRQFSQAITETMDARRSYGAPKSERDTNWAALAAWEAASRAVYESVKRPRIVTGSRIANGEVLPEWDEAEAKKLSGKRQECEDLEIKRRGQGGPQGIVFPPQELRDSFVGGAFVRAHLDGKGNVMNADVLAALPRPTFGLAA
ncbi:MAG: hypothetical protein RLZZ157_1860, partial [Pseudomonadota bacterium]